MISKADLTLVKNALPIYDRLAGRIYLIAYSSSKNQPLKVIEIKLSRENFWHLVGCKACSGEDHDQLFTQCAEGVDICSKLAYTRRPQDLRKKAEIFIQIFDFIANAKQLTLCDTTGLPEAGMFQIGAGSVKGIIGYANVSGIYIPKTTQEKSIYSLKSNASDRIFLVLSKESGKDYYDQRDYIISDRAFEDIMNKLPIEVAGSIAEQIRRPYAISDHT